MDSGDSGRHERRFRAMVENATDLLTLLDPSGHISYASPSWRRALGHAPEEVVGQHALAGVPEDERARLERELAAVMAEPGAVVVTQHSWRAKDGTYRRFESYGKNLFHDPDVQAVVVNSRDVTEREHRDAELRERVRQEEALARLGLFVVGASDLDAVFDEALRTLAEVVHAPLVEILQVERGGEQLRLRGGVGWREGLVGQACMAVTGSSQAGFTLAAPGPVVVADLSKETRFEPAPVLAEHGVRSGVCVSIPGTQGPFGVLGVHFSGPELASPRVGAFLQSVASLLGAKVREMDAAEALARSETQLRRSQRLEAIGTLAAGIAHDFNNMLTGIVGYAALAMQSLPSDHPAVADLGEIEATAKRAAGLTRQILAFGRRQTLQPIDTDLNELLRGTLGLLERVVGASIQLDFLPGHELGTVRVDPAQIEQVVLNLCVNARDAMTGGGRILLETENVRVNGEYVRAHPWAKPGRYVLLTVSDTGGGMPPDVVEHVFEPFFTTKDKSSGTGLGLATVHGIVLQHGGMIHVYSEVGQGTTFKVYLPIVERSAARVESKVEAPVPRGQETILLAEDDEAVRRLATRILERGGYRVVTTKTGAEAVAEFRRNGDAISLVLLDVIMPDMGGREALAEIRKIRPVPFLLASGYAESASSVDPSEARRWLAKPYDPDALLRRVRAAIDEATK
jgi:PAS domain S-box-containing protein